MAIAKGLVIQSTEYFMQKIQKDMERSNMLPLVQGIGYIQGFWLDLPANT